MGKIFCRIYQGIMKIGMYFLPWKMPEVLEGAGCIRRLPAVIRQKGYKNVLIVTDAMLVKLHLLDALIEALDKEQVHYTLFDGVEPNPSDINIEAGVSLYKDNACDAMIAFGGGSPMDCAAMIPTDSPIRTYLPDAMLAP